MTILFDQFLKAVDYQITEGSVFNWKCFPNARYLDSSNDFGVVSAIFSTVDQCIYQMEVQSENHPNGEFHYRWTHPDWTEAHRAEEIYQHKKLGYKSEFEWTELEDTNDILEKASATLKGEEFDSRISVPLELEDDVVFELMKLAHERDITFNQLMIDILEKEIAKLEKGV